MKRNLKIFKGILALCLTVLILFSTINFDHAETSTKTYEVAYEEISTEPAVETYEETGQEVSVENPVDTTMEELELLKEENLKIRNELMKYKIKVQGKADKVPVLITMDDGYLSNLEYAYPIMKEYGFKGTIFMIGKNTEIEPAEFSPDRLGFISNKEIHKYTDVFEFECHSYGMHPTVDGKHPLVSAPMKDIEEDLKKNRELYNTKAIAYPHGAYNQNLIDLLIKEDYKLGFAGVPGYANKKSNPFEIKRFGIYPYINMERFKSIVNGK